MYVRALEVQTRLEDAWAALAHDRIGAGPRVATDVREATVPPAILVTPPEHVYDLACGATLRWSVVCLAPGPGNADAWRTLDALLEVCEAALEVERARPGAYVVASDMDPFPALYVSFTESR